VDPSGESINEKFSFWNSSNGSAFVPLAAGGSLNCWGYY